MLQLSPETLNFIREHSGDNVRSLALQASKYPLVDMTAAITQIAGRQIATEKIPSWREQEDILYPRHLSMEQCSSELTARYKATLAQGESFADLTGGFGIDCTFLATGFRVATYVERQEELCEIAAHNFPALGLSHIQIRNEDGVTYLKNMQPVDCLFIDPARRNEHGGKIFAIKDCEPDVAELEELLLEKAKKVIIKLSPMLDLAQTMKEMKYTSEVHIISVNNECKELLLILNKKITPEVPIHCVNLTQKGHKDTNTKSGNSEQQQHFLFTQQQERSSECIYTHQTGHYLYEPNASILKAGAFKSLTSCYPLRKLHPNSHLYTSDELINDFPGRVFRIIQPCGFSKKEIKETLGDSKKANITVRNFPASVAELRKRLRITDGGEIYLFATTLNNEQKVLIRCEKV